MVMKHYCDICGKELPRPIDRKQIKIVSLAEEESYNYTVCIDCLTPRTVPELVSKLMFSDQDPRSINFNQFVGKGSYTIIVSFGDIKSLLTSKTE